MLGDVVQAERLRVLDQQSQDAPAHRGVSDRLADVEGDAGGDEFLDEPLGCEDAERAVRGVGDLDRELHEPLQDSTQRQLGCQRQACLEQHTPLPIAGARRSFPHRMRA